MEESRRRDGVRGRVNKGRGGWEDQEVRGGGGVKKRMGGKKKRGYPEMRCQQVSGVRAQSVQCQVLWYVPCSTLHATC